MLSNKPRNLGLAAFLAVLLCSVAGAEDSEPDKFRFAIGAFTPNRVDSNLSLSDSGSGVGISINPRDTLGLDVETGVVRIEGYYRFTDTHALTYSWYRIDSDGNTVVDEEFDWVDEDGNPITIPIGARAKTSLSTEIYKLGYQWSFYRSQKMEVGVGAGLHITRLTVRLDVDQTNPPTSSVERVDTTLPLPVISLAMNYHVTPKFNWYLKTEAFTLDFGDTYGTYRDTLAGLEYRAWKHVGLGLAFSANTLDLEEEDSDTKLKYRSSMTGSMFYVATYF